MTDHGHDFNEIANSPYRYCLRCRRYYRKDETPRLCPHYEDHWRPGATPPDPPTGTIA